MSNPQTAPPPYTSNAPNTQGPAQYNGGQPYMGPPYGGPPYGGPHYGGGGGGAPIIIMQQQQQQQQQQQVIVRPSGTNHGLCCLIWILTGGLSTPCWIWACITD